MQIAEQVVSSPNSPLISAREALSRELSDIEVRENSERWLSPNDDEYAQHFASVRIRTFDDLQLLGLVPRKMVEAQVRHAIEADNSEAYRRAQSAVERASHASQCGCQCEDPGRARVPGGEFRSAYNAVRRFHNVSLAKVFSERYRSEFRWDDPAVEVSRRWIERFDSRRIAGITALFARDIRINRNAKLHVDSSAHSLFSRHIWIHRSGQLIHQGSYLRIWATSISHLQEILQIKDFSIVWREGIV